MDNLRNTYPIKARKIVKKSLKTFIVITLLTVFMCSIVWARDGVSEALEEDQVGMFIGLAILGWFVVTFLWTLIYQWLYFKSYGYSSDDNCLSIKKGVVSRKEITIPYSQITDIYVEQGIWDRVFGLYDLHFSTPTDESLMVAHIDGLDEEGCNGLKQLIIKQISHVK